jgi:hypothetical protein
MAKEIFGIENILENLIQRTAREEIQWEKVRTAVVTEVLLVGAK